MCVELWDAFFDSENLAKILNMAIKIVIFKLKIIFGLVLNIVNIITVDLNIALSVL